LSENAKSRSIFYTSLGLLSLIIWSTSVVVSRSVSASLGMYTAGSMIYLLGGLTACLITFLQPNGFRGMFLLSKKYLIICGLLFIFYIVFLFLAISIATSSQSTIVVGLINYFWPSFIFLFSIPILGRSANWMLLPGMLLASAGVCLAAIGENYSSFSDLLNFNNKDLLAYCLAFKAAICWGLYTNFCQKWNKQNESAVPLFFLFSGIILLLLRLTVHEESNWNGTTICLIIFNVLFPVVIAYRFWDFAIYKGNVVLVSAASYFTPVLSTIMTSYFLAVSVKNSTWIGCALVALGAVLCKFAFNEKK
jgi:drug/metabolite transporter (DMT)-like permease